MRPTFLVDALPAGATAVLAGDEGRHAATVTRLGPGERLDLVDGAGGRAVCTITAAFPDALSLAVDAVTVEPLPSPSVTVVQALAKGDRGELAVQMLTEAGVDTIVPWQAARSVVRWSGDRGARALTRWRAVAREAAKQSRRARHPAVLDVAAGPGVVAALTGTSAWVLHEEADAPLARVALPTDGTVVLVVGPEGGVTPEELAAFTAAGARAVRLGPTVLRTSTAGVAALAVVSAATGRW